MAFQTTNGSQRERWVLAFLPAVAIFALAFFYMMFFALPTVARAERDYRNAVTGSVPPGVVDALNQRTRDLAQQQTELRRMMESAEQEVADKARAFQTLSPTAKHAAVTRLIQDQGVAILMDQPVTEVTLPNLRAQSVQTLRSLVPEDSLGFRELTLSGDYATIVLILEKLPEIAGVIPFSITLEKGNLRDASGRATASSVSWKVGLL
ncbi:MAG: hypothetical protein AAFP90_19605, partial [Planctomycetota bacterium]